MTTQERIQQGQAIYQNAKDKGFHDVPFSISHYLMLIITELAEAVEAHRKGVDVLNTIDHYLENGKNINGDFSPSMFEEHIKDTWQDEIADVYIRLMDLCFLLIEKAKEDDPSFNVSDIFETLEEVEEDGITNFPINIDDPFTERCYVIVNNLTETYPFYYVGCGIANIFQIAISLHTFFDDLDLDWHVAEKMKYNATRPRLHGKSY